MVRRLIEYSLVGLVAATPAAADSEPRSSILEHGLRLASRIVESTTGEVSTEADDNPECWLLEDQDFGQWGLHVLDPADRPASTAALRSEIKADLPEDHIVVADFAGDSDRLVAGRGAILVSNGIDPIADWDVAGPDLETVIWRWFASLGVKYWTPTGSMAEHAVVMDPPPEGDDLAPWFDWLEHHGGTIEPRHEPSADETNTIGPGHISLLDAPRAGRVTVGAGGAIWLQGAWSTERAQLADSLDEFLAHLQ